jgi:hypothetical protein
MAPIPSRFHATEFAHETLEHAVFPCFEVADVQVRSVDDGQPPTVRADGRALPVGDLFRFSVRQREAV